MKGRRAAPGCGIGCGLLTSVLALVLTPVHCGNAGELPEFEHIRFDDLSAELPVRITWSWNAIGMDPDDDVYAVFGGPMGESHDCVLFRYRPRTGERQMLGTMAETAKAADNWREGERIEKGHTHLPHLDGRIYIGTMGFHNAKGGEDSPSIQYALNSRGAHIMAYDISTNRILDLSAHEPDGVFFRGRGFIALETVPERRLLLGLTIPYGDVLVYDPAKKQTLAVEPGVPEHFGKPVGREIVAAPNGKVYYCYHPLPSSGGKGHMYVYDLTTGKRSPGAIETDPTLWNGQTKTRDGKNIYLCSQRGDVYRLDYQNDALVRLGCLFTEADRKASPDGQLDDPASTVLGMTLSLDERKIYCVPTRRRTPRTDSAGEKGKGGGRVLVGLCEFDLETSQARRLREFPPKESGGWATGSNLRDRQGNIYFARHGGGFCGLLRIQVGRGKAASDTATEEK